MNDLVADAAKPGSEARMKDILKRWRDNQAELQPQVEKSLLLKAVAPLSQNLSALGAAGLAALYYIDRGQAAPPEWVTQQTAVIEQARKAQAQLLITVTPSVEKLIQASARHATPSPAK